ncbi:hypothetical protein PS623_03158 [Pseudomonas fluorescens]|nr:hypothetical protein PS623_03158 [Pseudomonas fluorescens]
MKLLIKYAQLISIRGVVHFGQDFRHLFYIIASDVAEAEIKSSAFGHYSHIINFNDVFNRHDGNRCPFMGLIRNQSLCF